MQEGTVEKTESINCFGFVIKGSGEAILLASIKMAFRLHELILEKSKREENFKVNLEEAIEQEQKIKKSIGETKLLLSELQHRIKNSLQRTEKLAR